mgnify:CR=1 FL=1
MRALTTALTLQLYPMSLQMVKSQFANMLGNLVLAEWVVEENHSKATYTDK